MLEMSEGISTRNLKRENNHNESLDALVSAI